MMIIRAFMVWCLILICAMANGGVRDTLLVPRVGETIGRGISSVVLSGIVLLVSWLTIRWIAPASERDARFVGIGWLGVTLAFELLAGHFVMHTPWDDLLIDYNVLRGRIWLLVLTTTALAPAFAYQWTRPAAERKAGRHED